MRINAWVICGLGAAFVGCGTSLQPAETDPAFAGSAASQISQTQIDHWNSAETDPLYSASTAASIASTDLTKWNAAYGWGNHADAGYLTSETDPLYSASTAASIASTDLTKWNAAYGWGNHADAGYLTSETDPLYSASTAASIASTDVTKWNAAYGWGNHASAGYLTSESDPKVGSLTTGKVAHWNGTSLANGALVDDGTAVGVGTSSPTGDLDVYSSWVGASAIDANNTSGNAGAGYTDQWQSFTPTVTGKLTQLDMMVGSPMYPSTSPGTISIYAGEGTGGALLASIAVTFDAVNGVYQSFTFPSAPLLIGGQKYSYRFTAPSIIIGWVDLHTGDPYPGGKANFDDSWDFLFKTHIAPVSPPASTLQVKDGVVNVGEVLHLKPRATAPDDPKAGDIYFDENNGKLKYFSGAGWVAL